MTIHTPLSIRGMLLHQLGRRLGPNISRADPSLCLALQRLVNDETRRLGLDQTVCELQLLLLDFARIKVGLLSRAHATSPSRLPLIRPSSTSSPLPTTHLHQP